MSNSFRKHMRGLALGCASLALLQGAAFAQDSGPVRVDIPAQSLSSALTEFGRQAGAEIVFTPQAVESLSAPNVEGELEPEEALRRLLAGTGLTYRKNADGVFVIEAQGPPARSSAVDDAARAQTAEAGEIVVTGTRIKGVSDQFSPVLQVGRDEMDNAGYANVSDVFDDLTQNFGGGVSLHNAMAAGSATGIGAASVNLRGLGNEATLILLNGRRLAPGGLFGSFVDISAIPASAIDRLEVLTDGASAIYGSDAIAGVVNIVLREDFEGAETRVNLSAITDGGGETLKVGQAFGVGADRAHALLIYEYSSEGEVTVDDRDFAAAVVRPTWLLPFSQKHNVLASAGADLSNRVSLSGDVYYNHRYSKSFSSSSAGTLFQTFQPVESEQYGAAAGLEIRLFGDWEAGLTGSYSRSSHDSTPTFLHSAIGEFVSDASTSDIAAVDVTLGGSLFGFAEEPVRAVVGVHYRSESVDQVSLAFSSETPAGIVQHSAAADRKASAVFAEIYAPIVTEANGMPLIDRLAATAAIRYDAYSDVGSSVDPKLGVVWSPVEGLDFRGTYGTSFRAARLDELQPRISLLILIPYIDPASPTGESVALNINGSTGELAPEQAETWTAGFDFTPPNIDTLRLRATYFSVVYEDRIGYPTTNVVFDASGGIYYANHTGLIERNPSAARIDDLVSRAETFLNAADFFPYDVPFDIDDVSVILDGSPQNLAASEVEGVDIEIAYDLSTDFGDWGFFLNGTYLLSYTQQPDPVSAVENLLDTFNNPVDLRLRGGLTWRRDGVAAGFYVNYTDDYLDDEAPSGPRKIDSWTTIDASLRVDLGEIFGRGAADGASVVFSVSNLTNEDPPAIEAPSERLYFFDHRNADASGRRIGLLLTKKW